MKNFLKNNASWVIGILVVMDLGLLAIIAFAPKPGPPPPGRMVNMWRKELDLSAEQIPVFEALEAHQRAAGDSLSRIMNGCKSEIIQAAVQHPGDSLLLQKAVLRSDSVHHALNNLLVDYYFRLREACTETQKTKLEAVYLKAIQRRPPQPGR